MNYHKSVFAFLDLLACKEKLESDEGEFLNTIHNIYKSAIRLSKSEPRNMLYKIFSDNIVFEIPMESESGIEEYISLAGFVSIYQEVLLRNNLLLRGGITVGASYTDDIMVFGKALVSAYNLESHLAIYPRIVIDPKLSKEIIEFIDKNNSVHYCRKKDKDGNYFVDYLFCPGRPYEQYLPIIDDAIAYNVKEMEKHSGDSSIMAKLIWQQEYLLESKEKYLLLIKKR